MDTLTNKHMLDVPPMVPIIINPMIPFEIHWIGNNLNTRLISIDDIPITSPD